MTRDAKFVLLAGEEMCSVIVTTASGSKLIALDLPPQAIPAQRARAIADVLRANGYDDQPLVLALASASCFPASISISDLPKIDGNTLLYRLEEKLPFAAESIVADFVVSADRALGVCVKPDWLVPLLQALASAGVDIRVIAPAAMLAAQGCGQTGAAVLAFPEPSQPDRLVNLIALQDDRPLNWATVPATNDDVVNQAQMMSPRPSPTLATTRDVDAEIADVAAGALGGTSRMLETTSIQAMARAGADISAGRAEPWLNFRKGALAGQDKLQRHRRPLNALLAAAAVFFLAVTVAAMVRVHRYRQLDADADREIRTAFLAQFPNWSGPVNVAIIESEHRKALAAAGTAPPIFQGSALKTLAAVLSHLPADENMSITRMSFGDASFEVEGRASDSDRIDALVTATRGVGMNVPPPQTRKGADNSWSFVVRGERSSEASALAKDAGEPQ